MLKPNKLGPVKTSISNLIQLPFLTSFLGLYFSQFKIVILILAILVARFLLASELFDYVGYKLWIDIMVAAHFQRCYQQSAYCYFDVFGHESTSSF